MHRLVRLCSAAVAAIAFAGCALDSPLPGEDNSGGGGEAPATTVASTVRAACASPSPSAAAAAPAVTTDAADAPACSSAP